MVKKENKVGRESSHWPKMPDLDYFDLIRGPENFDVQKFKLNLKETEKI